MRQDLSETPSPSLVSLPRYRERGYPTLALERLGEGPTETTGNEATLPQGGDGQDHVQPLYC